MIPMFLAKQPDEHVFVYKNHPPRVWMRLDDGKVVQDVETCIVCRMKAPKLMPKMRGIPQRLGGAGQILLFFESISIVCIPILNRVNDTFVVFVDIRIAVNLPPKCQMHRHPTPPQHNPLI